MSPFKELRVIGDFAQKLSHFVPTLSCSGNWLMSSEQVQNKRAICLDLLLFIVRREKRVQPREPWILNVDANNARVEKVQHATPISSKQCSSCPRATNIIVCFFSGDGGGVGEILLHAPRLSFCTTKTNCEDSPPPPGAGRRENKLERTNLWDAGRGGACKIRASWILPANTERETN